MTGLPFNTRIQVTNKISSLLGDDTDQREKIRQERKKVSVKGEEFSFLCYSCYRRPHRGDIE